MVRFYPRHPRGWRRCSGHIYTNLVDVSIHATLAGGDPPAGAGRAAANHVSIHATLAGGDKDWMLKISTPVRFYPRHPRGWRPPRRPRPVGKAQSFYPRHPRGWRRSRRVPGGRRRRFYPRHPRGWRPLNGRKSNEYGKFLSTPPSRVATGEPKPKVLALNQFLSTPPSRVATPHAADPPVQLDVSIHATLAGGDGKNVVCCLDVPAFLSTPPSRVATSKRRIGGGETMPFLSTPPSRVATAAQKGAST